MIPQRIQRKREHGWRMPPNAIYVGRPSPYGNPFKGDSAVGEFHACLLAIKSKKWHKLYPDDFRMLAGEHRRHFVRMVGLLDKLRGKDLVCWCPLDQPCHADVLLKLANQ